MCTRGGRRPSSRRAGRESRDSLLDDDTPERVEADRRTVEAWERAHGTPDIKGAADEARAKVLG